RRVSGRPSVRSARSSGRDLTALSWIFLASSGFSSQRRTRAPGSRAAGHAMAFKLIESAQTRRRAVNAPHLVALVRAGAVFKNGVLVERPDESTSADTHAA